MTDLHSRWAKNIEFWRKARGFNQQQFAEALGVRQSTVSRWETAKTAPSDAHKVAIANLLDIDPQVIFPLVRGAA